MNKTQIVNLNVFSHLSIIIQNSKPQNSIFHDEHINVNTASKLLEIYIWWTVDVNLADHTLANFFFNQHNQKHERIVRQLSSSPY